MAAAQSNGYVRGQASANTGRRYTTTYIDGNVVRRVQVEPKRALRQQASRRHLSSTAVRNREKALHMTLPYVMFLMAAAVMAVFLCVQYLQLQAQGITYRNEIAALESRLSAVRLANDNAYEEAMSSVNMEQVKETAVHELGMVYASEGQVILYDSQDGDYIRQYGEIPEGN